MSTHQASFAPTDRAHIELLGHVAVRSSAGHTALSGRPALVLAALVLQQGPVSATRLTNLLWTSPPRHQANALQRHISRVRSVLAHHGAPGTVHYNAGAYELDRDVITIDTDHLESFDGPARRADLPYPVRWWLEPLAPIDHVDFAGDKWRIQRRCNDVRSRMEPHDQRSDGTDDIPTEVIDQLDRWLDLRAAHDEAAAIVRRWLDSVRPLHPASPVRS